MTFDGDYSARKYPTHSRRIRIEAPETGETLNFPINNMASPALTIAALCTSRWQRVQLFSWITQHLRVKVKHCLGSSENAVKTQMWCAVGPCVLIAIVWKQFQLDASLYTCLRLSSVSVFEKSRFSCALQADADDMSSAADLLKFFTL